MQYTNARTNGKACKRFHMSGCQCECLCECGKWIAPWNNQCECEYNRVTMNFDIFFTNLEQETHLAFACYIDGILALAINSM